MFSGNLIAEGGTFDSSWIIIAVIVVLMVGILFVWPMLTNKKRQKQIDKLYEQVIPGAKIKTVGGIIGTVVEVITVSEFEKQIVVETGSSTMLFDIQAVYQVMDVGPNAPRETDPSSSATTASDEPTRVAEAPVTETESSGEETATTEAEAKDETVSE